MAQNNNPFFKLINFLKKSENLSRNAHTRLVGGGGGGLLCGSD